MNIQIRFIAIAATVVSGFAAAETLAAATCNSTAIAYQASGEFGAAVLSGLDKLELAGEPFSITLYACETKAPIKTGSDYAEYSGLVLEGEVKSHLLTTFTKISTDKTTFTLAVPPAGYNTIQLTGAVVIEGATINISANIALPVGTFTATSIAPFASASIVTARSQFTYSQGSASTSLAIIGTVAGNVYTGSSNKVDPVLHSGDVRVIASHADGTQSMRLLEAGPVDPGASLDKVMLQFYASGIRDASEVHVRIAGQEVPVLYSGPAGHFPGVDEVTVEVPRSLAGMGETDVDLTADGRTASPVRIHIQ
ncbi:MAG: hypothetical protein ABSG65_01415 [Bryobacteraceae bacterium]|jgi:hypothetical protein